MRISVPSAPSTCWIQRLGLNSRASGPQTDLDVCSAMTLMYTEQGGRCDKEAVGELPSGMVWSVSLARMSSVTGGKSLSVSSYADVN